MEFSFRDLRGQNECAFRRAHKIDLGEAASVSMQEVVFEKKLIKGILDGAIKLADIQKVVETEIVSSGKYRNDEQAKLKAMDMVAEVKRCVLSIEDQKVNYAQGYAIDTDPQPKDITVPLLDGTEITVKNVRPDLVITFGNATRAILLRTGKPSTEDKKAYTWEDAEMDKRLYFLMRYAKEYAEERGNVGDGICVTGGQWFLRKPTDRKTLSSKKSVGKRGNSLQFDTNLFYDDEMKDTKNIFGMTAGYTIGVDSMSEADGRMMDILEKFSEGLEREECSKEQCKYCEYDQTCHYTHAPQRLPETPKEIDLSAVHLSKAQEQVERFDTGYAVVNAGPGSGKTFILCLNVCSLLLAGVKPEEILVIAFSRSAANVFQERIQALYDDIGTGEDISGLRIVTFNEFGQGILTEEYQHFGFARPPRVIQQVDRFGIIEKILNANDQIPDLDYRNFSTNEKYCKGPLAVAAKAFQAIKENRYTEFDKDEIVRAVEARFCTPEAAEALARLYVEYDAYLKDRGLVEYADQEMMILDLLKEDPYYFDKMGFSHILVDEAQDCSPRQFKILKYLTQSPTFESVMLVGDDSQSIYRFRGADPREFMNFERIMGLPAGTVQQFYMMDNFRSTPEILDFANKIIESNFNRVDKTVIANKPSGAPVVTKGFYSIDDEYKYIADGIKEHLDNGVKPEEIAFIAYNQGELSKMASILADMDIESVMLNPEKFNENSRVLAGLALARCIRDPGDTKDVMTCLNAIYDGDLFAMSDEMIEAAIKERRELYTNIAKMPQPEQKDALFAELELFDEDDEVYQGFLDMLKTQPSLDHVYEYCENFAEFGGDEKTRREANYPGVALTTAHSSKGMEWKVVYNSLSKYDDKDLYRKTGSSDGDIEEGSFRNCDNAEERRRLLFVSATRAKDELYVTGQFIAYGGNAKPHYNIFLEDAFNAAGETWDTEAMKRQKKAMDAKRKEAKDKRKAEERAKIAEKAKEAIRKAAEEKAKATVGAA